MTSRKSHTTIVKLLETIGADVYIRDKDERTPFFAAFIGAGYIDTFRVLLNCGFDSERVIRFGMESSNLAVTDGYAGLTKFSSIRA